MKEPRSITGTILNVFTERICHSINYLSIESPNNPLWDVPMKMYLRVEQNPLEVDSIVLEAKKNNVRYPGTNTVKVYQGVLSRVYIILYYRHRDDELYKNIVFPMLIKNMGFFSQNHLKTINNEIDNLLKQEEMIDDRKKQTSNFTIPKLNRGELDELFDEYNKEKLFRQFVAFYEEELHPDNVMLDCAELWYVAKDFIRKLWHSQHPESYIERIQHQLAIDDNIKVYEPELVIICMYIIMRALNGNHFAKTIEKIEGYENRQTDFHYLSKTIHLVKHWINEVQPYDGDYDYLSEQNEVESSINDENNTISSKSIATAELKQRIDELEAENAQLKEKNETLETKNQQLKDASPVQSDNEQLGDEITRLKQEKEEMIIELIMPIFYNNVQDVRDFLQKINGRPNTEITDTVFNLVKARKISDKSKGRPLWMILHAAKLYSATEQNWNAAIRTHP